MSADRPEAEIRDQTRELAQEGDQMEERLDELSGDIADAKKTANDRQDAPSTTGVAGDWESEATGASQGEDAEDAERPENDPK